MRLRFGRISLCDNLPSPCKTFPITSHILAKTESPLSTHYNPQVVSANSLEDFLGRSLPALSFFATRISKSNRICVLAIRGRVDLKSLRLTQSRLHCTQHKDAPHKQVSPRSVEGFHVYRVGSPRQLGRDLHAVASRPKALTPSNSPDLGKRSHHQKLHRYALRRYFTPVSGTVESD